jgi:hypothetical protein
MLSISSFARKAEGTARLWRSKADVAIVRGALIGQLFYISGFLEIISLSNFIRHVRQKG